MTGDVQNTKGRAAPSIGMEQRDHVAPKLALAMAFPGQPQVPEVPVGLGAHCPLLGLHLVLQEHKCVSLPRRTRARLESQRNARGFTRREETPPRRGLGRNFTLRNECWAGLVR